MINNIIILFMNYLVFYEIDSENIDVSQIVIDQCTINGIAYIPKGETA